MARASTYLNFNRQAEAAMLFYRAAVGGDCEGGSDLAVIGAAAA